MPNSLRSWNDGAAKRTIVDFVERVTTEGGADYVSPSDRIATFDNDGTLWSEQPMQTQVFFAQQRLKELAAQDPAMRTRQPFRAFLEHDLATIHSLGKRGVFEVAFATHAGMTTEAFQKSAATWLSEARHPKLGRPFGTLTYQPQIELLDYLRANGFKTYIVTGGGVDFVRAFAERAYGIPPEQVIGSSVKLRFEIEDQRGVLVKEAELDSFDDREVKPANIELHVGRRPILAFGNSDGDLAMLRYTKTGSGPCLALLLHHDDAEREFAYDRDFQLSPLAEALDKSDQYGIMVVSLSNDWREMFVPTSAARTGPNAATPPAPVSA